MKAWSYSALSSFELCPRRHYQTKVSKEVTETEGEALLWGNRVHKALENYLRDNTPLPAEIPHQAILDRLLQEAEGGELLIERQLALTRKFAPCEWMAEDVWVRGVVDFGFVKGEKGLALDWKTGKRKLVSDQLDLFALLMFHHFPALTSIKSGFVWLKTSQIDTLAYTREELPELWSRFLPRVSRLEQAFIKDHWPPKPSGICRGWCPCKGCEFCY